MNTDKNQNFETLYSIVATAGVDGLRGEKQLKPLHSSLREFFPANSKIFYSDLPIFKINEETGELVHPAVEDQDVQYRIFHTERMKINPTSQKWSECKFIYVYQLVIHEEQLYFRGIFTNLNSKKAATFTISETVMERFSELADKFAINKSKFVENKIKEFIEKNQ